jgi:hypothetical protein
VNAPAAPGRGELVQRIVLDLGAAFQLRTAYTPGHPQVTGAIERVLAALAACCNAAGSSEISFFVLEGQLLADRIPVPEEAPWGRGLLRAFRRHGIGGMTLVAGVDAAELGRFFDGCMSPQGPAPSAHVLIGQGGFAAGEGEEAAGPGAPAEKGAVAAIPAEQVSGARGELRALVAGAVTRVERLRSLVALLSRSADAAALEALRLASVQVNDREFLHGLAVALTTLRLTRALGVQGKALEDLALAGLLHDVGHLEATAAEEAGDRRRGLHPTRGAARLAAIEGIPDVAVRAAYEHHLRFDGAPSYPAVGARRQPGAAARVVAVADTWETLRARGQTRTAEAIAILRSRAGTWLDPALVDAWAGLVLPPEPGPA